MPAQTTAASPPPAGDDLDDLFNYDVETDDVFRDYNPAMDAPVRTTSPARPKATDLGIDEEIQVAKQRRPVAKLDENRLLSQAGIPKLRRITKERLKFKGKGHEYSDVARLLNLYQLWLDDLYPRAKFADGLAMIEKLGHTKRLQTMRREWIKAGKPLERREEDDTPGSETPPRQSAGAANGSRSEGRSADAAVSGANETASMGKPAPSTSKSAEEESLFVSDDEADLHPSDDDIDALLAEDALKTTSATRNITSPLKTPNGADHHPPEDDLDALLAEETSHAISASTAMPPSPAAHDEFEDEMEAMAGMDDMW
ncbi:chromosome segregation in meiosis- protein [Xylographa trunciseda]|nr:chromosome segregation in meiosis- protein [Xylographa trunciseda]